MNENQFMSVIFGTFIVFLLLVYGVFSDILKSFIDGFGAGYGLILGLLFCLIIVLSFLGGRGRR